MTKAANIIITNYEFGDDPNWTYDDMTKEEFLNTEYADIEPIKEALNKYNNPTIYLLSYYDDIGGIYITDGTNFSMTTVWGDYDTIEGNEYETALNTLKQIITADLTILLKENNAITEENKEAMLIENNDAFVYTEGTTTTITFRS
jgi:hypothetical protein